MSKITSRALPFIFPVSAVLIFWMDVGKYTPHIGISLLFLGIAYSLYNMMTQKKAVVASTINIYFILIIILAGVILFFLMIKSGV
ncbi:hypothetical protein [Ectobacillus panaciterrae]|uniref:hypothetical protein n=1 Tax=Ectobacillus panaciterrae TaxID=363872 RepID=UPI00048B3CD5|nr:hypothetical protein [Ectobacillus panaciterrae]